MKLDEIKKIARLHNIKVGKTTKSDLVRAIQRTKGHEPCFDTGKAARCGQEDCLWRVDCEHKLKAAQRLAHVGHWVLDLETDRVTYSDETYRIFGLQHQLSTLSVPQLLELVHPEDRAKVAEAIEQTVHGGPPYDVEYRVVRPDGEVRFIYSHGEAMGDGTGRPRRMFGVMHDITELRRVEKERNRLITELEQRVHERTEELEAKNAELERMNRLFVDRELRMVELKKLIRELEIRERENISEA